MLRGCSGFSENGGSPATQIDVYQSRGGVANVMRRCSRLCAFRRFVGGLVRLLTVVSIGVLAGKQTDAFILLPRRGTIQLKPTRKYSIEGGTEDDS